MARVVRWWSKFVLGIFQISNRLRGVWFGLCLMLVATTANAFCSDTSIELRWQGGTARFTVELADTPPLRTQGLMHRESMGRYAGMLFIYDRPRRASFWMRNTLIPLDMLFFDPSGKLVKLHENAIPLDETSIDGGSGVLYVLEINGGLVEKLRIGSDVEMRHPRLDQETAVWACTD